MSAPAPGIAAAARALASGRVDAATLVGAALDRIEDPDGEGARAFVAFDRESAMAAARHADRLRARGIVPSSLAGLPVSIKDAFDVAGEVTRAGSVVLADAEPASVDAVAVARLRAAGAVLVGRTNMTEFAFSGLGLNPHYGTPRSPYERERGRIAGGSTSGGAVSVCDDMAYAALGSDTGGSVRIPAAFCGVVGFKPTAGRIPTRGLLPLSQTLDAVGVIARSVDCCARLDALLAGETERGPRAREVRDLRIGVAERYFTDRLDREVAAAFAAALEQLSRAGALLAPVRLKSAEAAVAESTQGTIAGPEAWAWHRELLARRGREYDPRVAMYIASGADVSAAEYVEARERRGAILSQWRAEAARFDAVAVPTVMCIPPPASPLETDVRSYVHANLRALRNTSVVNALDGCAITLPCHRPGDAPVGLMLFAPAGADRALLDVAAAVEAELST